MLQSLTNDFHQFFTIFEKTFSLCRFVAEQSSFVAGYGSICNTKCVQMGCFQVCFRHRFLREFAVVIEEKQNRNHEIHEATQKRRVHAKLSKDAKKMSRNGQKRDR